METGNGNRRTATECWKSGIIRTYVEQPPLVAIQRLSIYTSQHLYRPTKWPHRHSGIKHTQKLLIYTKRNNNSNNNSLLSQQRQMTSLRIRRIASKQRCDKQQPSTAVSAKRATRLNKYSRTLSTQPNLYVSAVSCVTVSEIGHIYSKLSPFLRRFLDATSSSTKINSFP